MTYDSSMIQVMMYLISMTLSIEKKGHMEISHTFLLVDIVMNVGNYFQHPFHEL